jgi:hypothetical protein
VYRIEAMVKNPGQHFMDVGATGRSDTTHLHIEIRLDNTKRCPGRRSSAGPVPPRLAGLGVPPAAAARSLAPSTPTMR